MRCPSDTKTIISFADKKTNTTNQNFHLQGVITTNIMLPLNATLQTLHVYSTLKRRENGRFHVVSTWNTRGVFVGYLIHYFSFSSSRHRAHVKSGSNSSDKLK